MKKISVTIAALFLLAWIGCSRHATEPTADPAANQTNDISEQTRMLMLQYGTSDDPSLTMDVMVPRDSLRALLADTSLDIYSVTLLWGMIWPSTPPMPPLPATDWSGTMGTNAIGFMRLLLPIDFEPDEDKIVPTANPMSVAWVSHTSWDIDGLSVLVCLKRGVAYLVEPTFAFDTKPLSFALPVSKLDKLDTLIIVDRLNALAMHSRKLPHVTCPSGKIAGKWTRTDSTMTVGTFDGVWTDDSAAVLGHLTGTFWRADSHNLLEGKYTDSTGEVIGHLKGTWCFDDPRMCITCGTGMGMFIGQMINLDGKIIGRIQGRFGPPLSMTDPASVPFVGIWQSLCIDEKNTDGTVF